jgi:ubiquitin-conjugating enzyme E2 variant
MEESAMTIAGVLVGIGEAALVLLFTDFVSGLVHWAEDTFGSVDTPVVGRWIVGPNVLHHLDGAAFLTKSWLASSWDLLAVAAALVAAAWWAGHLDWHVWLFALLGANANQLHKWNHGGRSRRPMAIRWLQGLRILQTAAGHAAHHKGDKNTAYCVITPYLNPLLDRLGVWRGLEGVLARRRWAPRRLDLEKG